jgi:hypothetical protein
MKIHELKCDPEPFVEVLNNLKRAELRKNDRGYEVGDVLHLQQTVEARHETDGQLTYTGRACYRRVIHIQNIERYLPPGFDPAEYVLLSIRPLTKEEKSELFK